MVNPIIRGWASYFRIGVLIQVFGNLDEAFSRYHNSNG